MNSEPLIEKNGTPASPATARASSVFPVPGGPISSTPLGICAPEPLEFGRALEEFDNFLQLELGLLQGRYVLKRRSLLGRLEAFGLAADEVAHHAAAQRIDIASHDVNQKEDQRSEADEIEDHLLGVAWLTRLGVDFDPFLPQVVPVIGSGRNAGREDEIEFLGQLADIRPADFWGALFHLPLTISP